VEKPVEAEISLLTQGHLVVLAAALNTLTISGILKIFSDEESELEVPSGSSPRAVNAATWATQSTNIKSEGK
jgi:hypothetical protein